MNWIDTLFHRWGRPRRTAKPHAKFRPRVEMLEAREVPALLNFLQGFAFIDANANGLFDSGESPKVGTQIRLSPAEGSDRIAVTDSNGYYRFTGLNPGETYTLSELTPPEFIAESVQVIPLVSQATVLSANSVRVTLGGDDGSLAWTRTPNASAAIPSAYTLSGGPLNDYTSQLGSSNSHQYQGFLSDSGTPITPAFLTYCVDLFHANPSSFGVSLSSEPYFPADGGYTATSAENVGRIAYLYNMHGRSSFTGSAAGANEAGLGLAFYELLYDFTPDLFSGNFRVQMSTSDPAVLAAQNYLAESAGKSQSVVFLNVNAPPDAPPNFSSTQGMLGTELFNFANRTVTSPPPPPGITLVKTADKTNYEPGEAVTYKYVVTNTGGTTLTGVSVRDDNATPTYPADDFTAGTIASLAPGSSATFTVTRLAPTPVVVPGSTTGSVVSAGTLITEDLGNAIRATYIVSPTFNDNVYGTSATPASGWPSGHTFNNLVGSDHATFQFKNTAGAVVLDFDLDYISASTLYSSGYGSLGVSGGDGGMNTGSAANVVAFTTSLTQNLNSPLFVNNSGVRVNSPINNPNWIYEIVYSATVSKSAFGTSGFGSWSVPEEHNSPPKTGKGAINPVTGKGDFTNVANVTATASGTSLGATATATIHVEVAGSGGGNDSTKFFVVEKDKQFGYTADGTATTSGKLGSGNARGIASNKAGDTFWVIDDNKTVYVYDAAGKSLGSWKPGGLDGPEDITTDGTTIWIVDAKKDKVFTYSGAAALRSGSMNATSSFALAAADTNAMGVITDGTSLWTVDDGSKADTVYKYSLSGSMLGSWTIDAANSKPRGLTIDPNNVGDIWIVDDEANAVFRYAGATARTSGSQAAADRFNLASGNSSPQGIADPPPPPVDISLSVSNVRHARMGVAFAPAADLIATAQSQLASPVIARSSAVIQDQRQKAGGASTQPISVSIPVGSSARSAAMDLGLQLGGDLLLT